MKKQLQVWQLINKSLQQNIPVMLLYVLESFGSSPGRAGFCMAVTANGEIVGSIGGGIMEHKFVEMAKEKLNHDIEESIIYKQIHDKSSTQFQSGMICSGEQSNLMYRVRSTDSDAVNRVIDCIENINTGKLTLSKEIILFDEEIPEEDFRFYFQGEDVDDWLYEEKIGYKNKLHIIGAGHCALALSKILQLMDFYICLYDERKGLNTFLQNDYVHEKLLLNDYSELKNHILSGNDYVVVMTMGYRTDDITIRALLHKKLKYLGVLGSKKKIEKMFTDYHHEGIDENLFGRIFAPAGLSVNSQTPEEIAISIAAQIIAVKNDYKE